MRKNKKIINYTPFNSSKSFSFEVPDNATEDDIHSIANKIMLNNPSVVPSEEKQDFQQSEVETPSIKEELADTALGMGQGVLNALGTGFNVIDRVNPLGAGLRASAKALIEGDSASEAFDRESVLSPGNLLQPATTGKEVIQALQNKMGVNDVSLSDVIPGAFSDTGIGLPLKKGGMGDITLSGALGTGIEVLTDPFTGALGKPVMGSATKKISKPFKNLPEAAGEALTGIKSRAIRTYMDRPGPIFNPEIGKSQAVGNYLREKFPKAFGGIDPVAELGKKYGSDETSIAKAVAEAKDEMFNELQRTKRVLGKSVNRAIERNNLSGVPLFNKEAINVLERHKNGLPDTFVAEKEEIQTLIDDIKRVSTPNQITAYKTNAPVPHPGSSGGILNAAVTPQRQTMYGPEISLKELNAQKQKLQNIADGVYVKGGQLFNYGKKTQYAAKDAARAMRSQIEEFLDTLPVPDKTLKESNRLLGLLHDFEDRKGIRSLLNKDSAPGDLLSAGAGANPNTLNILRDMDSFFRDNLNLTPTRRPLNSARRGFQLKPFERGAQGNPINVANDFTGTAENLAAYNQFKNPPWLPVDTTGKAVARQNMASTVAKAGASAALGSLGGPIGAVSGLALNSPVGLKGAINSYRALKRSGAAGNALLRGGSIEDRSRNHQVWLQKLMTKIQNTPYQQQFSEAAQKGEQSVNSQFFKTYLSDPEFQKLYSMEQSNQEINDGLNDTLDEELE